MGVTQEFCGVCLIEDGKSCSLPSTPPPCPRVLSRDLANLKLLIRKLTIENFWILAYSLFISLVATHADIPTHLEDIDFPQANTFLGIRKEL